MPRWLWFVLGLGLVQDLLRVIDLLGRYFNGSFLRRRIGSSLRATCRINFPVNVRRIQNPLDYLWSLTCWQLVISRFYDHRAILSGQIAAHFVLWRHIGITILLSNKVIGFSLCLIHSAVIRRMRAWLDLLVVKQAIMPLSLSRAAGHGRWWDTIDICRWLSLI